MRHACEWGHGVWFNAERFDNEEIRLPSRYREEDSSLRGFSRVGLGRRNAEKQLKDWNTMLALSFCYTVKATGKMTEVMMKHLLIPALGEEINALRKKTSLSEEEQRTGNWLRCFQRVFCYYKKEETTKESLLTNYEGGVIKTNFPLDIWKLEPHLNKSKGIKLSQNANAFKVMTSFYEPYEKPEHFVRHIKANMLAKNPTQEKIPTRNLAFRGIPSFET